jgi:hypothetical protein
VAGSVSSRSAPKDENGVMGQKNPGKPFLGYHLVPAAMTVAHLMIGQVPGESHGTGVGRVVA